MNYRHSYHAGNFADVFKHCVLITLLQALQKKDTPICYLDTHAGTGLYDLKSNAAQKSKEYLSGISLLFAEQKTPAIVQNYLACVHSFNHGALQNYPGSPKIARYFLRPQDRLVLIEKHPEDVQVLRINFEGDKQSAIHLQDGYQALKAFLPPPERRGLVFIDPPFESRDEFAKIISGLEIALKRWETGVYAVWYPIKTRTAVNDFFDALQKMKIKNVLMTELSIFSEDNPMRLNGCGIAIINAPWQLDHQLNAIVPWLWKLLSREKQGNFSVKQL